MNVATLQLASEESEHRPANHFVFWKEYARESEFDVQLPCRKFEVFALMFILLTSVASVGSSEHLELLGLWTLLIVREF
jgi:hypothetical protein